MMDENYKELERRLSDLETEIKLQRTMLIGIDGRNGLRGTLNEVRDQVQGLRKAYWLGMGALAVINILIPFILKNLL